VDTNKRKILEMVAEKKITVDEAERLLSLVGKEPSATGNEVKENKIPPRYLRVVIQPTAQAATAEAERVNIRVPVTLLRAGMRLASVIPPSAYNQIDSAFREKGVEFDLRNLKAEDFDSLIAALNDLEVNIENSRQTVHIYAE
jgi:hypothetical protein